MKTLYKLTDENDQTYGDCQWGENVTVKTNGKGELCGPGWTHWYTHPLLALLLNPIHGNYDLSIAHLWRGKGKVGLKDNGLKVGCNIATTLARIKMPAILMEHRVRFGILCALEIYSDVGFVSWATE